MIGFGYKYKIFPQFIVIHTVKGFGIVHKAEIDVYLELSCFFHDPADVGNLISGSSAFSKTSFNIREFTVHVLLKPGLEKFEHYFTSMWDEYNCVVVWAFFCIAFLWNMRPNKDQKRKCWWWNNVSRTLDMNTKTCNFRYMHTNQLLSFPFFSIDQ